MDPLVVEACRAHLPENACRLDDKRVHLHYENALKFIRRCEGKYDLIIWEILLILLVLRKGCLPVNSMATVITL